MQSDLELHSQLISLLKTHTYSHTASVAINSKASANNDGEQTKQLYMLHSKKVQK